MIRERKKYEIGCNIFSTNQTKGYWEYQKDTKVYIFIPNPNPIDYNKALIKELLK